MRKVREAGLASQARSRALPPRKCFVSKNCGSGRSRKSRKKQKLPTDAKVAQKGDAQTVSLSVGVCQSVQCPDSLSTESEAPEEPVRPNVTSRSAATAKVRPPPPTKQPVANPTSAVSASHKKKPITRRSRVGRNQYTKDRESAQEKKDSPRASHSRGSDDAGNIQEGNGATMLSNGSKPSKPRHMNPNRTSMNDLRKRAAGILEYITRTQVEMAGQTTPRGKESNGSSTTPPAKAKVAGPNGASKLSTRVDGADGERKEGIPGVDEAAFQEMSSLEMMDVLTRELVLWQKDYGKYGEKS